MAKSRKPKLQLALESTRPTPPGDDASVHPLTGRLRTTLDAIVCGTALVQNGLIPEDLASAVLDNPQFASMLGTSFGDVDDPSLDGDLEDDDYDEALDREEALLDAEIDRMGSAVAGIARSTRILARSLIAQTLGKPVNAPALIADGSPVDIGGQTLDDIVQSLQPASIAAPLRPSPSDLGRALGEAADLVREVGLEEFDLHCELASAPKGVMELIAVPVSPESAHVALIENLFYRADAAAAVEDPILMLERVASAWEFER